MLEEGSNAIHSPGGRQERAGEETIEVKTERRKARADGEQM